MIAAVVAVALIGGGWALWLGLRANPAPVPTPVRRRRRLGRGRRTLLVGFAAGLVGFAITGWPVLLLAGPVVAVALPWLLSGPGSSQVEMLAALDRWVHGLAATVGTGRSITDALRHSRRGAPARLAPALAALGDRLNNRWSTTAALRAMADDLDSPDADAVIAALMVAAERGGTGTNTVLLALAESNQRRLRALRDIEAERAKPRVVVRQVTAITGVVLVVAMVVGRDFFEPYGSPLGQVVLAVLVAAYLGSLVLLRLIATPPAQARILRGST